MGNVFKITKMTVWVFFFQSVQKRDQYTDKYVTAICLHML